MKLIDCGHPLGVTRQTLKAMKLTFILLTGVFLQVGARTVAQNVTYSGKNVKLETVFSAVEEQTGYAFFYNDGDLKKASAVTVDFKNTPLQDALAIILKNQPLTFSINGKTIVIKEKVSTTAVFQPADLSPLRNEPPPPIDITGRVTDSDGNPLSGATVKVKGTSKGTTTNNDGVFVLKAVDENATLEISFVGYETYTVAVNNKSTIVASLKVKPENLNEVIINKGYYTEKQKFSVSNVGRVTSKDIEKQPVSNPLLALEGRVPGLFIKQESGLVGGPVTIRIQGQNSIANGNNPLIVIDGIPFYSDIPITYNDGALYPSLSESKPSPLNFVNTADIESIDILKDADATAIYGSRAANGAILITTKKGRSGAAKIDLNFQQGWGKVTRMLDVLDRRQYLDMRYEAFKNDGISTIPSTQYDLTLWDTTRYTNWQKFFIGNTAKYTNANLSISGGSANIQYLVGGSYNRTTTVYPGNFNDQKGAVHFSIGGSSLNQKLKMQITGNYLVDDNLLPNFDLTGTSRTLEPVAPALYNADGSLNWAPNSSGATTWTNPMAAVLYQKSEMKTNNLISNVGLEYNILPGLEIKTSLGYNKLQTNDYRINMFNSLWPEDRTITPSLRAASFTDRNINSWIVEPQMNYQKKIGEGQIDVLLGYTINQQETDLRFINASGFSNDASLLNPGAAPSVAVSEVYSLYKYNASFARLNYNWRKKYIINLTARRDGSSRFGDKNKFHNFGSVGGAWIISEESFFPKNLTWLNFAKLRGSFGTTGSDQIGDYSYLDLYGNTSVGVPYQNTVGLLPRGLSNPYLQWEETRKVQGGVDLSLFHDRIVLNTTYVLNRSSNQLVSTPLPYITGYPGISANFSATVQNTSWEFLATTTNIKNKSFLWTSSINFTIPKNKLVAFPSLATSSYKNKLIINEPISILKAYHYAGVDPTTGNYQFFDVNGALTSNPSFNIDRTVLISKSPRFYGGFQNTISYKGFELDFLWQFVKQKGSPIIYYNGNIAPGGFFRGSSNQPVTVLNRWQKPGDISPIARFSSDPFLSSISNVLASDANYTDASFFRLKNLSLSWGLSNYWLKRLHLKNFRLYTECQNLITITNYQGLDPENQSFDGLPPLRLITTGIKIGF